MPIRKLGTMLVSRNKARQGGWIIKCWDIEGRRWKEKDFLSDNRMFAEAMAKYMATPEYAMEYGEENNAQR